ncbi:uncharacterized mitochondrial protein AtMg00810-like [Arachis hypogaea]|uniref:uncharacterized mitochondrial protein AtMg00810-like n=1 Tax=Arachis hypogaea TaxID=3818 RepID=UPI003B219642
MGFAATKSDVSLLYRSNVSATVFLLIYVDDIIVTGTSIAAISEVVNSLNDNFALKDLGGLHFFLGIKKAGLDNCKSLPTPMTSNPRLYCSIVGSLQYLTVTRPELAYSVNKGSSTLRLHLQKSSNLKITGYSDSGWASDPDDRKSTASFCVYMGPSLISCAILYCDNQGAVFMSTNPVQHARSKHYETDLHFFETTLLKEVTNQSYSR